MPKNRIAKRVALVAGGLIIVLVGGMGSYRYYQAKVGLRDVLPTFTEPGPGPRAPSSQAFGVLLGSSSFAEITAYSQSVGLNCADTSMRALMQQAREDKRKEIAAAAARGDSPDAVTGASMVNRRSPKEANPQIRLSCEHSPVEMIATMQGDDDTGKRPEGSGRLLMVFDSAAHPVRHVSFERTLDAAAVDGALAEFTRARRSMEARLGQPTKCTAAKEGEPQQLAWLSPVECEWTFADLHARVTAIHYGARGIVMGETVEVPWPVRADAPAQREHVRVGLKM